MKLNELLRKHGFTFSKKYGQNFISDDSILYAIAEKGGVTKDDPVLEIGCGAGTLTKVLCEKSQFVYGYEIDKTLAPVLGENLAGIENCEITFRDIMKENPALCTRAVFTGGERLLLPAVDVPDENGDTSYPLSAAPWR